MVPDMFLPVYIPNMRPPALVRRSASMMSDGSGEVPVDRLEDGQGKTKRVWVSAGHSTGQSFNICYYVYNLKRNQRSQTFCRSVGQGQNIDC